MDPLKIYFKIIKSGHGKLLKNRDEVNNLIVDVINRNPSKAAAKLREMVIEELTSNGNSNQILHTNSHFFINKTTDIEVAITFLPEEKSIQDQFYTQWRYVQHSSIYRLVQYLDEHKVVVYSEKTNVLHTIKLTNDITMIVHQD